VSAPPLAGVSHLGLSVADLDAAAGFWTATMGFEPLARTDEYCLLFHRGGMVAIVLSDHGGSVTGPFDERRTGLDHLALAVADDATLRGWVRHLDERGIEHSDVVETDAGPVLNLRGPDRFPVELFVLTPAGAAQLGLAPADGVAARTHELGP
jgi:glyoxylase I family protein